MGTGHRCPNTDGHSKGDEKASLSIFRDGNRTAARCHGCGIGGSPVSFYAQVRRVDFQTAGKEIAARIGLTASDRSDFAGTGDTEYNYTDEDGVFLFQAVRFRDPKTFRQRTRDERGQWVWKLGDTRRVLYHLAKLIEAVSLGKTVYVVEGDKDVYAVERAGGVGTCNAGGANKWKPEYTETLRGANVVIVADKDEAGTRHALSVQWALEGVAKSVSVVQAKTGHEGVCYMGQHVQDACDTDSDCGHEHRPTHHPEVTGLHAEQFSSSRSVRARVPR